MDLAGELSHEGGKGGQGAVQPLHGVLSVGEGHVGFKLAHDAPYVLTPQDLTIVEAAKQSAVLNPGDAAGVVSGVGVAHSGVIGAVGHGAGIAPGDASALGGGIVSTSVDFPQVSAALDHALIAPGNAAAVGVSGDRGPVGAAPHHAGAPVDAYQCAHVLISRHIASDGDLFHCAVVLTGQDAHLRLGAARGHYPVQNQIFYDSPLAQRAEQAYLGTLVQPGEAGNGVSGPVKGAAEHGNGGKAGTSQGNVGGQHHGYPLRPGIRGAALGQLEQPAGIMNGDGIPLRAGGGQQSQAEYQGQQQGGAPFCIVHHGVIPPFHPVPAACSQ